MNGKAMKRADLQADNGVIHFVSEMLEPMVTEDIPAILTSDGRFGTLLTAIEMAGLGEMLTQSTFFACNLLVELSKQSLLYLPAFVFLFKDTEDLFAWITGFNGPLQLKQRLNEIVINIVFFMLS